MISDGVINWLILGIKYQSLLIIVNGADNICQVVLVWVINNWKGNKIKLLG